MKTIAILSCLLFASVSVAGEAEDFAFFEAKVRPLLIEHCFSCHAKDAKKIRGELLLDSKEGWMKGGESGQVIIPGNIEKSLFVKVLSYNDTIQMPPKGKLADKDIAILTEWVKRGAADPRKGTAPAIAVKKIDYESAKKYWAWQPLKNVAP
ncbi:MAG: xanthan lyase, partial [Planctomycetia bacterium]|nr:xanthan lyase [Planctomycetia bacterium]